MSAEPPPANANGGYNPDDWTNANDPVDQQYLAQNYLQFPNAQGAETMGDLIVSGALTAQDPATFADTATFNNGINIGVGDLTFSDLTVQSTAFIEANYAQLNTDNTFLAPYQNTFAGNASTGNTNAPLKITNGVVNGGNPEYCTMYLDPNSGYDMTLYSAQSTGGGLTVRSANGASYTLNPTTITTGVVGGQSMNPLDMNGNTLYGLNNVYANTGSTITIQSPIILGANATATTQPSGNSTTAVATTAFVQNAVQVSGVQVSDTPLLWSGFNTWQTNAGGSTYTYPYGMSNSWNITNSQGDNNIIANAGTGTSTSSAFNIYCVKNDTSNSTISTMTPQLSLSNNNTAMQVKDGINIPSGTQYTINGTSVTAGLATTSYVNSTFAPLASPALTGTPTISTTPTSSQTTAIANVQYVANAISAIPAGALIQSGQINNCSISGSMSSATAGYLQNDYVGISSYTVNLAALGLQTYASNTAYVATACFSNLQFTLASGYMQMLYGMFITVYITSGSSFNITVCAPLHVNNPSNTVNGTPTFNITWTTSPRLATS